MDLSRIHQVVVENMAEAVYVRDVDLNIVYMNPAAERLTGWSLDEARGKNCYELFGEELDQCNGHCPANKAIAGGLYPVSRRLTLKTRAGAFHRMQASISPVVNSGAADGAVIVLIRDEDPAPDTTPKEICQRTLTDDPWRGEVVNRTEAGAEIIVDCRTQVVHDDESKPECLSDIAVDITARRSAERARAERERYLQAILDTAIDGFCVVVGPDMRIVEVNGAYCDMTGYTAEELLQLRVEDLDATDTPAEISEMTAQIVEDGSARFESRHRRKDGGWFDVEICLTYLADDTKFVCFLRDITERKRAEVALRESEERFRLTFQTSPDSININRLNDGMYVEVNDGFTSITGFTREEVIGRTSIEINIWHDLEDRKRLTEALRQDGYVSNLEAKFQFKGGTVHTGLMSARVIMLNGELHIVSITRDVEEWKQTQEALRNSERRFRQLFEDAPISIWEEDFSAVKAYLNELQSQGVGDLREFLPSRPELVREMASLVKIVDVNRASLKMYHARSKEELFEGLPAVFTPESYMDFLEGLVRIADGDMQIGAEKIHKTLDGRILHVQLHWNVAPGYEDSYGRVLVTIVDITERKKAEEALRLEHERLEFILEGSRLGTWIWNVQTNETVCNETWAELLGYSLDELRPFSYETWERLVHPDDLNGAVEGLRRCVDGTSPNYECEFRMKHKRGDWVWILDRGRMMTRDAEGKPLSMFGTHADITELKQSQELLLQSERHRAVVDLAAGVAHNFNNLLQVVIGNLELALMDIEAGNYEDVKYGIKQVLTGSKVGAETVRRLQSFAHIRDHALKADAEVFDASDSVRQALEMSKTWWKTNAEKRGVQIVVTKDLQEGCLVLGDKAQLFEVVLNLIKNSVDASPKGGEIELRTRVENDEVVVTARDTGVGISEDNLSRVFNPFFTTKADAGSGLGLSSSRKMVETAGGNMFVDSIEGEGTTFTVRLPLAKDAPKEDGPLVHESEDPLPGMTVLVIDDMEDTLKLMNAILAEFGHNAILASSGREGLVVFQEVSIDLIICDLGMPGMNGWEVGRRIRKICGKQGNPKVPFVLLTGWGGQKTETEYIAESGVDMILEKPIDLGGLRDCLRTFAASRCEPKTAN